MGKLVGKSKLSIDSAPMNKKERNKSTEKLGLLTNETTRMKSYRFRVETIDALNCLTKAVNKKTNIKISATNILELLVIDAAKEDIDKIVSLINSQENNK